MLDDIAASSPVSARIKRADVTSLAADLSRLSIKVTCALVPTYVVNDVVLHRVIVTAP